MARIKHIALSTDDPVKTAEFYKNVFGLTELRRVPADTGAEGVWLSDGYIYFAILKYGGEDTPNLGEGPSTVKGIHHIGSTWRTSRRPRPRSRPPAAPSAPAVARSTESTRARTG